MELAAEVKATEKQIEQVSLFSFPVAVLQIPVVMVTLLLLWLQCLNTHQLLSLLQDADSSDADSSDDDDGPILVWKLVRDLAKVCPDFVFAFHKNAGTVVFLIKDHH